MNLHSILSGALSVALAAALTGCLGDSKNEVTTTQSISDAYCVALDEGTGTYQVMQPSSYNIEYNYTANETTLKISGLKLPDDTAYPTVTIGPVEFKAYEQTWKVVNLSGYTGQVGSYASKPVFHNIDFRLKDIYIDNTTYAPAFWLSYRMSHYTVYSGTRTMFVAGKAVTTSEGKVYEKDGVILGVNFDMAKSKAVLGFSRVTFSKEMELKYPAGIDVTLMDLPLTFSAGVSTFEAASVVPMVGQEKYEKYPLTNFKARVSPLEGIELSFDCTYQGQACHVEVSGKF